MTYECDECGDEFDSKIGLGTHQGMKHENPTIDCVTCGKEKEVARSHTGRKQCYDCSREHGQIQNTEAISESLEETWASGNFDREPLTGEDNPFYGETHSDDTVEAIRASLHENAPRGSDHHHWRENCNTRRGSNWSQQRDLVRERDNYSCRICQKPERDDQQHDVHHIIPLAQFTIKEIGNSLCNLVTLCKSCHMKTENTYYDAGQAG